VEHLAGFLIAPVVDPLSDVGGVGAQGVAQNLRGRQQRLPAGGEDVAPEQALVEREPGDRGGGTLGDAQR
jgi:hypothetical protein